MSIYDEDSTEIGVVLFGDVLEVADAAVKAALTILKLNNYAVVVRSHHNESGEIDGISLHAVAE